MIAALLLTLPATALLAAGTPRQAQLFAAFARHRDRRRTLRLAGYALLAAALLSLLGSDDGTRHLIALLGLLSIEAVIVALVFTIVARAQE